MYMSERRIYIDGDLLPASKAKVSVFDHGLLYGDGVFEGIRVYGGKVYQLDEHLKRLYDGSRSLMLAIPIAVSEMAEAVRRTVAANAGCNYVRLVVTRGPGDLGLNPRLCKKPCIIIIADQISLYPKKMYEHGLEIITAATMRTPSNATPPQVKSLNYLNSILAKLEGERAGVPEAVMLNHLGFVAECTGDNIFAVVSGELRTPPPEAGILRGITRATVMTLAGAAGMACREANLTIHDLYAADEVFLTGTAAEIIGVAMIDGRTVGAGRPGPVTLKLTEMFHAFVSRTQARRGG
jgi:branched-chain amino acid aminotransferase